jgi:hypothetical protein
VATRPAAAAPPAERSAPPGRVRPRNKPQRIDPSMRQLRKPTGKVRIKEPTDKGRLVLTVVIAAVIIGAVGFLVLKYL